jgi:hypothetical protein
MARSSSASISSGRNRPVGRGFVDEIMQSMLTLVIDYGQQNHSPRLNPSVRCGNPSHGARHQNLSDATSLR